MFNLGRLLVIYCKQSKNRRGDNRRNEKCLKIKIGGKQKLTAHKYFFPRYLNMR